MTVRELMTSDVVSLGPDASITDAGRAMRDSEVGSVVVIEDGRLLGILSDRDIAVRAVANGWTPGEHQVREIMTTDPITVNVNDDPLEAARVIGASHVRRLPVVEDSHVAGIVSAADLADYIDEALAGLLEEMEKAVH